MVKAFDSEPKHSVYNIGSGKQTSLNEIIAAIEMATGCVARVAHADTPETFLNKAQVSVNRYINEFGPVRKTSIASGLKKTIKEIDDR